MVGGLAPLKPGYGSVLVAPQPGGGLTEAATSLETPPGRASVRWSLDGDLLTVDAELPEGVDGILRLPGREDQQLSGGPVSVTAGLPASVGAVR